MATSTAAKKQYIEVAQSLHPRLLNFFKKHAPPTVGVLSSNATVRAVARKNLDSSQASTSADATESSSDDASDASPFQTRNPFLPMKDPRTGTWIGPAISLRRQAELYKIAMANGVLDLMPRGPKHPEVREQKRIEQGLRVQGTGIGKKVKGKHWERTMQGKLEERRKAMAGMPELIRQWRLAGSGRYWKKWPK
jgi:large subunit ribosomal protein L25